MNVLCIRKPLYYNNGCIMYNKTSAGLYVGIGRSLCQSRPVSMSEPGPYGPQGPWAQPLFDCVETIFFVRDFGRPKNRKCYIS